MKKHLSRKVICDPTVADVCPMVTVVGPTYPTTESVTNITNITHNNCTTNTTINNNNNNITNVIINPYNREDLSHITDAQWQSLVHMGKDNNMHRVISTLVALVNYNPSKPENMNLYMPPEKSPEEGALVFQRKTGDPMPRWRRVTPETAVAWLMNDRTSNIFEWTDANKDKVNTTDRNAVEDFFNAIGNANEDTKQIAELIHRAATSGSEIMLVLRGGHPPIHGSS
jgi:hypothetical protein